MKKKLTLLLAGLFLISMFVGCGNNSTTDADKKLDATLTKVINNYFTALKTKDRNRLYPVVTDEVYRDYSDLKISEQEKLIGDIVSWKIDRSTPPQIDSTAGQALYNVNVVATKKRLSMVVDLRPYYHSWCVFGVKVSKSSNTNS